MFQAVSGFIFANYRIRIHADPPHFPCMSNRVGLVIRSIFNGFDFIDLHRIFGNRISRPYLSYRVQAQCRIINVHLVDTSPDLYHDQKCARIFLSILRSGSVRIYRTSSVCRTGLDRLFVWILIFLMDLIVQICTGYLATCLTGQFCRGRFKPSGEQ